MNEQQTELDGEGFLKNPDPLEIPTESAPLDTEPPKKRGRPKGSKNQNLEAEKIESGGKPAAAAKPSRKKASYDAASIALMGNQLVGVHAIASQITGLPELQISDKEGFALAQSIVNVAEQYDLAIDGKTGAALQLVLTAAMVYGPRVFVVNNRMKTARKQSNLGEVNGTPAS